MPSGRELRAGRWLGRWEAEDDSGLGLAQVERLEPRGPGAHPLVGGQQQLDPLVRRLKPHCC